MASKRERQPVTCLDCKVTCSAESLCRCCVAIAADRSSDG
jgi:hypothetical protein